MMTQIIYKTYFSKKKTIDGFFRIKKEKKISISQLKSKTELKNNNMNVTV